MTSENSSEMEIIIDNVIENAQWEDMIDVTDMRDEIIEMVADELYAIYTISGLDGVKDFVKKKLKIIV